MGVATARKVAGRAGREASRAVRRGLRTGSLPDFVILGAMRSGTSSLSAWLGEHPAIARATVKEVHYFDRHFDRGQEWYRANFPSPVERRMVARRAAGLPCLAGDATPNYLFHPPAASRIADLLPEAKLVVLLRDPVARAISGYYYSPERRRQGLGMDPAEMQAAFEAEAARIDAGEQRGVCELPRPGDYDGTIYLARGIYADQLEVYFDALPRERFLILESGRFFADPAAGLERVLAFLGLPSSERSVPLGKVAAGRYPQVGEDITGMLREFYRPRNRRLYELLGEDLGWDAQAPVA